MLLGFNRANPSIHLAAAFCSVQCQDEFKQRPFGTTAKGNAARKEPDILAISATNIPPPLLRLGILRHRGWETSGSNVQVMSIHNSRNGQKQIFKAAMAVLKGEHTALTESANRLLQR